MTIRAMIDGVERDLTPEEEAAYLAETALMPRDPIPDISRRQFFQQLAVIGVIAEDEALAAMGGSIPAALVALVAALPADNRFSAKMLLTGASTFQRSHPDTQAIAAAYQWPDEQVDQFFVEAAQL